MDGVQNSFRISTDVDNGPVQTVNTGPNGSVKSSSITASGLDRKCPFLVNPDNFSRCLRDVEDETEGYVAAIKFCERLRHLLLEFEMDFGFETVGSTREKIEFISEAKERGYSISLLFVCAGSPETCIERIGDRVRNGGHDVPEDRYAPDTSASSPCFRSTSDWPTMRRSSTTATDHAWC